MTTIKQSHPVTRRGSPGVAHVSMNLKSKAAGLRRLNASQQMLLFSCALPHTLMKPFSSFSSPTTPAGLASDILSSLKQSPAAG